MTDIELKYYIALQEKFKEAMGPWQEDDPYYDPINKDRGYVEEIMPDFFNSPECDSVIRLPLPIDPVNPERGLWGMIDWGKFELKLLDEGLVAIYWKDYSHIMPVNKEIDYNISINIALLKAIAHQWGIEVPV